MSCVIRKLPGNYSMCLKSQALSASFECPSASALHPLCFPTSDGTTWRHSCWGTQSSGPPPVILSETRVACVLASQEVTWPHQSCPEDSLHRVCPSYGIPMGMIWRIQPAPHFRCCFSTGFCLIQLVLSLQYQLYHNIKIAKKVFMKLFFTLSTTS